MVDIFPLLFFVAFEGAAEAFLLPRIRDLPWGYFLLTFEEDLLVALVTFLTDLEGVVLRYEREVVCFAVFYLVGNFLVPSSSLSNEFLPVETFAGFDDFGSLNFLSVLLLFLVGGAAVTSLPRPRFIDRGKAGAIGLAKLSLSLAILLLLLPARRSSRLNSFAGFLVYFWAVIWPLLECLLDERIIRNQIILIKVNDLVNDI